MASSRVRRPALAAGAGTTRDPVRFQPRAMGRGPAEAAAPEVPTTKRQLKVTCCDRRCDHSADCRDWFVWALFWSNFLVSSGFEYKASERCV